MINIWIAAELEQAVSRRGRLGITSVFPRPRVFAGRRGNSKRRSEPFAVLHHPTTDEPHFLFPAAEYRFRESSGLDAKPAYSCSNGLSMPPGQLPTLCRCKDLAAKHDD
jgi:hypothetical protein